MFSGKAIGGEPTTSPESLEVGFFPIHEALEMVKLNNFKKRIEYTLKVFILFMLNVKLKYGI
ncbi:hypothetical protein TMU01_30460 [Tenuibacillus multivorans]|nr:hypothetical protein TMU01_30460 [Tenuibacillus multivorans]